MSNATLHVIPPVRGLSVADATSRLGKAGFRAGGTSRQFSDQIAPGHVVGTEPSEGVELPEGTRVDLVVSIGHEPTGFVPSLAGLSSFEEAASVLARDGYSASLIEQPSPMVEVGVVIGCSPPAGTCLTPGSNVSVIVSSGWTLRHTDHVPEPPQF